MSTPIPPASPPPAVPNPPAGIATGTGGHEPRAQEAGAGVAWWREGWQIFVAAPWIWIGMTLLFVVIMVVLGSVPLIGGLADQLLSPVFAGGAVLGCLALARGDPLTIGHLFEGFKAPHFKPLLILGAVNLGVSFVVWVLFAMVFVGAVGMGSLGALLAGDPVQMGAAVLGSVGFAALLGLLLALVVVAVLAMLYWFAPMLVVANGLPAIDSMKTSFRACLRNMGPFLVYGLLFVAFAVVASIPFGLGWIVLAPVTFASLFASWRQVFGD